MLFPIAEDPLSREDTKKITDSSVRHHLKEVKRNLEKIIEENKGQQDRSKKIKSCAKESILSIKQLERDLQDDSEEEESKQTITWRYIFNKGKNFTQCELSLKSFAQLLQDSRFKVLYTSDEKKYFISKQINSGSGLLKLQRQQFLLESANNISSELLIAATPSSIFNPKNMFNNYQGTQTICSTFNETPIASSGAPISTSSTPTTTAFDDQASTFDSLASTSDTGAAKTAVGDKFASLFDDEDEDDSAMNNQERFRRELYKAVYLHVSDNRRRNLHEL
ncbi:hypothetical protein MUCCIDRAFT_109644 [Mucor lusitanicus CBS 277.49]|uniref:Uncharacterized protein n=1 Tax=Mucor lusitanicus CBS 277.49 TaxID=747725 RepID=A0A162QKP0_MUCCL|nr:hypothetical protein MUCCIDRAFT_109644 [Mucor lusitanicus CBS 277.49]